MFSSTKFLATACLFALASESASAEIIGGVEFPQGAISFADTVVSYSPGSAGNAPTDPHQGAFNALGVPDYDDVNSCPSQADCSFVSLGASGQLVVQFTDNVLTGSGTAALDLWIFEVGPAIEGTALALSTDGVTWIPIGSIGGATAGIDIDALGFGTTSEFSFVRLTDLAQSGSGLTPGADIDAVGAISTRAVNPIPEPSTWALLIVGFGVIGGSLRMRARAEGVA